MKAKITIRNILFLMLSVILLCSVMSLSTAAADVECSCDLDENGWSQHVEIECMETQYCENCGVWVNRAKKDSSAHNPGLWEVVTPHTCENPGLEAIFCTDCGHKIKDREIPAHDYEVLYQDIATCQADGYRFVACLTCYDMRTEVLPMDKDAHIFTEWQITTEATCATDSGVRTRYCKCKSKSGELCTYKETENYSAPDNHIENDWEAEGVEKVAPTCAAPGYLLKICEGCEKEIKKVLPQHSESKVVAVYNIVPSTCSTHGSERRKCECGYEYEYEYALAPDKHVYGEWIVTKEPSCTEGKRNKYCKYHYNATVEESIPKNGVHNYGEWESVIVPDCSKTGLEEKLCADCGNVETRELPTKHDFTFWEIKAEMSCDESKLTQGSKLAKCNNCNFEKHFSIPALHNYGPWVVEIPSRCKDGNEGTKKRTCVSCGKVESDTYIKEHDFSDWYVTNEAVCAVDGKSGLEGQRSRWCRTCGQVEHKTIPVTHEFVDVEITKYPECSKNGVFGGEKTVKCAFCDLVKEKVEIEGDHSFSEWVVEVEPTCAKDGKETKTCIACGYTESRTVESGHTYGNWTFNGNLLECGNTYDVGTLIRNCSECGIELEKNNSKVTANHINMKTIKVKETCSTSGYEMKSCPDCGFSEILKDTVVSALGHDLDEKWTSRFAPTCTTKGSRYKACANCDYIEYQEIDRAAHMLIELVPGVDATCIEWGKTPQTYCAVCKEVFESVDVSPIGHNHPEGVEVCTRCGAYKGSDKDCVCACHSKSGMEAIFFKIINKLYQFFGINKSCRCGDLHYTEVGFFGKLLGRT